MVFGDDGIVPMHDAILVFFKAGIEVWREIAVSMQPCVGQKGVDVASS